MKQENTEELKKEIKRLQKELERYQKHKYGLVWMEREEEFDVATRNKLPILREVKDKAISNEDGKPTHIIIEGDNYHALTCLNYTHKEKIDLIYIDPPYNTGNKDFKYNDTFIDKESPFRHSAWLSFMSKRLELAKNLLSSTGVILISIDENEIAQLKLLCDKIFDEKNFIEIFCWEKTQSPSNLSNKSKKRLEYVLCYEKARNNRRYVGVVKENDNDNPLIKSNNSFKTLIFPHDKISCTLKEDFFFKKGEYGTKINKVFLKRDVEYKNEKFESDLELEGKFIWTQENLERELEKNTRILFKGKSLAPRYDKAEYKPEVPSNVINWEVKVDTNDNAKNELLNLGFNQFTYPKPTSLIRYLISFQDKKSFTILDFFAGSGTTLHSTMDLNEDDEGKRQCILVNSNREEEGFICEKITYERNKRVIEGYIKPNGEKVEALGNSLKYYRTDFIGKNQIDQVNDDDQIELCYHAGELLALAENTLYEIFKNEFFQIFADTSKKGKHFTAIYFQENLNEFEAFETKVASLKGKVTAYIFSWSEGEFEDVFDTYRNVAVKSIPQPILEIYKNILSA